MNVKPNQATDSVKQTFLALRLAPVLLVLVLAISVIVNIAGGCILTSISAYYYTSSGPAFVGMLCAIGVCLIINRGDNDAENVLLDFAGFVAFVVAFVPTLTEGGASSCQAVPSHEQLEGVVSNNVIALLPVGLLAIVIGWILLRRQVGTLSRAAWLSIAASVVALAVAFGVYHLQLEWFRRNAHLSAAFTLFACIAIVVGINSWSSSRSGRTVLRIRLAVAYAVICAFMVVSFFTLLYLGEGRGSLESWLFWAEAALILGFALFWILQTIDLQGNIARHAVTDEVVTNLPADPGDTS